MDYRWVERNWFSFSYQNFEHKPDSNIGQLIQSEIFSKIKLDSESQTLYWKGLINMRLKDGPFVPAPLDFFPDILFENSTVADK